MRKFISKSEQETRNIGKKIAASLRGGEILALQGELGAGKTVLTKGIAEGLGYKKIVNSPTFILMKIYKIKFQIHPASSAPALSLSMGQASNFKFQKNNKELKTKNRSKLISNICHIDAYRINNAEEIEAIGALEYFGRADTVSIIEWPERIKKILPKNTILINLKHNEEQNSREIEIKSNLKD